MTILVTGGAGFIGSNFVLDWISEPAEISEPVINLDALTYAGNRANLDSLIGNARHTFIHGEISDGVLVGRLLREHRVRAIVNFAAESHVDRSIHGPATFVNTNVTGTFTLLEESRNYWSELSAEPKAAFRFLHVSTDEVYGSLGPSDPAFTEGSPYAPNSPYSATKAAADHLVRAYHHTYGLPTLTTNCSNNYGPFQFPEKLVPLMILNGLAGKPMPIYGDGQQIRDWLFVSDHCEAIRRVLKDGRSGQTYNIGGGAELTNLSLIYRLCETLERHLPRAEGTYAELIRFVADRPGHDRRYAVDFSKIRDELGWTPRESFNSGLERTVRWYLDHPDWIRSVQTGDYRKWIDIQYEGGN